MRKTCLAVPSSICKFRCTKKKKKLKHVRSNCHMYVLTHYTLCFENPCDEAAHITFFFGILTFIKKPNKTDQGDSLEITNKKPKIDKTKQKTRDPIQGIHHILQKTKP